MAEKIASAEKILQNINDMVGDESRNQEFAKLMENTFPSVDAAKNTVPDAIPQTPPAIMPSVDNAILAEEVLATPTVDAAKNIVPEVVSQEPPVVMPISVKNSVDVATVNNKHAQDRIIKKQKEEEQKKEQIAKSEAVGGAESIDKAKGADAGAKPEQVRDPLEEAIKTARQQYARTEFRHQEKMRELEKGSGFKLFKMGKRYAEGPDTRTARETYEATLRTKMDMEIAELEARNINGQYSEKKLQSELKELYTCYNVKAAHELFNARTEEIIASKKENSPDKSSLRKGWDKVSLGMTSIANYYNKEVPLYAKAGLAVTSFVLGAGAFTTGKRVFGAIVMATTGGIQLDAACQFLDRWNSGKTGAKNIKESANKEGKINFEKFKESLNGEIDGIDKKLDKYVSRSRRNKVIAVGMALVFGTLAFSPWAHALPNNGSEHGTAVPDIKHVEVPKSEATAVFDPSNANPAEGGAPPSLGGNNSFDSNNVNPADGGAPPNTAFFEHPKGAPVNFAEHDANSAGARFPQTPKILSGGAAVSATEVNGPSYLTTEHTNALEHAKELENISTSATTETVVIKAPAKIGDGPMRHDSFMRSLKDHIKGHPGIDKDEIDHITAVTFRDAASKYAGIHKISYDEAVARLSRIHQGTSYELTWDSNGHPHMNINEHDVKFVKGAVHGHNVSGGNSDNHGLSTHNDMPKPTLPSAEVPKPPVEVVVAHASDVTDASGDSQWNGEALENQKGEFDYLNEKHQEAFNAAGSEGGRYEDYINENMYRAALGGARKSLNEIASNPNGNYTKTLRDILKTFSDNKLSDWNRIEKLNASELLSPEGRPKLGSLSEKARHTMMAYAKIVPPKGGEPVGRWVVRFMRAAKDGLIKK